MTNYKTLLAIATFLLGTASFTSQAAAAAEDARRAPMTVSKASGPTHVVYTLQELEQFAGVGTTWDLHVADAAGKLQYTSPAVFFAQALASNAKGQTAPLGRIYYGMA